MSVTIKEIAEMAGVHRSTVDKVLHGRPGVSDPVRQRVQKIIDECNYQVNPIGKALKMQDRELHIKVILLDVDAQPILKKGIKKGLDRYGAFQIKDEYVTVPYSDVKCQADALERCRREQVDGIILSPVNAPEIVRQIDQCDQGGIPVITVNTDIKGSQRLCYIGQDGFKSGRIAGRLMGEFLKGEGKVAVFTSDGDNHQSFPFGTREGGFRELISSSYPGVELLPSIYTQEKTQVIRKELRKLLDEGEELAGIYITCGGVQAVGDVLDEYERRDIRLVCYENYPEILEMMRHDLVTVSLDSEIEKQGEKAVEVLMEYLIYDKNPPRRHLYTETKILLKESL